LALTLLIGNPRVTWREWLREHRRSADFVCLDPADAAQLTPGLLNHFVGTKPRRTRFYGSLDAQRHPHLIVAFAARAREAEGDVIVQSFSYRASPVMRQTTLLLAQMLQPDRILVAEGTDLEQHGFPIGPEPIELEPALPPMVQHAQRKAQWLKMLEQCERHTVNLREVSIEGSRLGSGRTLTDSERKQAGLSSAVYAEAIGSSLLIVTDADIEESHVSIALDYTGCSKAVFTEPGMYRNLVCSFANQSGEDFGFGIVLDIDWRSMRAQALCTAVPPAPVRLLRLGSLRVDSDAREIGEHRPWQV